MTRRESGLRVAVAQPLCTARDVAANVLAHAEAIRHAGARLVVFPQFSLTGHELDADALCTDDARLSPLVAACGDAHAVALVGAPVVDADGREFIATLAVDQTGVSVVYRKINLHPPEPDRFEAGPGPTTIEVDGWRLGLGICRDTGVAQSVADAAALGIDAYVAGALFTDSEAAERDRRMASIARTHGVWVLLAAFAGVTEGFGVTSGGSGIWGPDGRTVVQAGTAPGELAAGGLS